ncbi:MAG: hypothetical protein OXP66_05085 [Candidatus Tectomicrobia bacterium]|nr:hypothetical protein [Candidatus Tectomicrobia bacterium]
MGKIVTLGLNFLGPACIGAVSIGWLMELFLVPKMVREYNAILLRVLEDVLSRVHDDPCGEVEE